MEITAKPRRRRWPRALRAVLVAGALWGVVLLIPLALGLQTNVIDDEATAATHARGSLVFDERISATQLEVGDVATFVPPGLDPADGSVTRRVVVIDDGAFLTRRDSAAAVDPWVVPLSGVEVERAAFSVPWLGYPMIALEAVRLPPWGPAALVIGLVAVLLMLRRGAHRSAEKDAGSNGSVRARSGATAAPPLT